MDILERNYISIDRWNPMFPEQTTFLLTHLHTDHLSIPRTFQYHIYTSTIVTTIWDAKPLCVMAVLEPGQWYYTCTTNIPFQIVPVDHTLESIGFFFPSLSVVYMGDGLDPIVLASHPHRPLSFVYDGLYEHITLRVPPPEEACRTIKHLLETSSCQTLRIVHHGILSFLRTCGTTFRLDTDSLSTIAQKVAINLDMQNEDSPYTLVGRSYPADQPSIIPTSNWFFTTYHNNSTSIPTYVYDGIRIRVFCTLHVMGERVRTWRDMYPMVHFEPMVSRSI
jgi:hypothetical protein